MSELSTGQTVCDVWHQSTKPKNAHVAKVRRGDVCLFCVCYCPLHTLCIAVVTMIAVTMHVVTMFMFVSPQRMDVQGFWQVMLDAIEVADRASPLNK